MKFEFAIPNGWYRICDLATLKARREIRTRLLGGEIEATYLGQARVLFRDAKTNSKIELVAVEQSPFLFAWFSGTPQFKLVPATLLRKDWSNPFHLKWRVRSNMTEIAENAADMGHFTSVHIYKEHARLNKFTVKDHEMTIAFNSARRILGVRVPIDIELHYQGLGWVESTVRSSIVEAYVCYTPTPIDHEWIDISLSLSFQKSWNPLLNGVLRLALPWEVSRDFERDIPIWENKVTHSHPILCAGDGPIMKLRHWADQFYSPYTTIDRSRHHANH